MTDEAWHFAPNKNKKRPKSIITDLQITPKQNLRNCQMSNDKLALIIAMTMSKSRKSEFLEHTLYKLEYYK